MTAEPTHCQPHSVAEPCAACNTPKTTEAEAVARLRELVARHDEHAGLHEWLVRPGTCSPATERHYSVILAHIDGEPARAAAAVAAAREETVAACAVEFERALAEGESFTLQGLATPLADRIAELTANLGAESLVSTGWRARAEKAEAERDAARTALSNETRVSMDFQVQRDVALVERDALRREVEQLGVSEVELMAERDALRAQVAEAAERLAECAAANRTWYAQVEAVRALCARFDRGGGTLWPGEVLAAMDGATP